MDEEVSEGAKPDFLDLDGDGDKKESMKKASKEVKEGDDEELQEEGVCEDCGEVHEGGCGHQVPVEDGDMFDSTEEDGDYFDDEEDGFNQDKFEFGGFGFNESDKKSNKDLISEDIKKMKQLIKPISKI